MIEVEVKARVNHLEDIKKELISLGTKFLRKEKQTDKIFGHPKFLDSNNMIIEGGIVPRIRQRGNKIILEFKEICRDKGGFEIKSELINVSLGIELLEKLGFKEAFTISKEREEYSHGNLKICLDSVESLGDFIEIEKMISLPEKKDEAKQECINLLNKISTELKIESLKYGDLIQEKINKEKNLI